MAKRKLEHKGNIPVFGPAPQKGPDWGEIFGGIIVVFFIFVLLASCGG